MIYLLETGFINAPGNRFTGSVTVDFVDYGQFSMSIALYWVDPVIWALEYQQIIGNSFLNTYPKEFFEYLAYPSSYTHFIVSIIPRNQL